MSFKKKPFKSLNCKICKEKVEQVDHDTVAVTCWKCVTSNMGGSFTGDLCDPQANQNNMGLDCQDSK